MARTSRAGRVIAAASLGAVASVGLAGCGPSVVATGQTETEERDVGEVTALDVDSSVDVTVTTGERAGVVVSADSAVIDRVRVDDDAGTLRIGLDPGVSIVALGGGVRVDVTLRPGTTLDAVAVDDSSTLSLDEDLAAERLSVEVDGSATLEASETLTPAMLTLEADGTSDVDLAVDVDDLAVDLDSSTTAALAGEARTVELALDGSSDAELGELTAADATVTAGGSSTAVLAVTGTLTADADGSSTIRYVGEPDRLDAGASGSADIGPVGD